MFKCSCCDAELPDGTLECPQCKVFQEPPAKYAPGSLVKIKREGKGVYYINYVVDSYYNRDVGMHLYRLNEILAMPVYREDWLEPVSDSEIEQFNASGDLAPVKYGGWTHPIY